MPFTMSNSEVKPNPNQTEKIMKSKAIHRST